MYIYQSKLPEANVPLRAWKGGFQEKIYFLLGCVRCASGKYDLNDRECDFRNLFGLLLDPLPLPFLVGMPLSDRPT